MATRVRRCVALVAVSHLLVTASVRAPASPHDPDRTAQSAPTIAEHATSQPLRSGARAVVTSGDDALLSRRLAATPAGQWSSEDRAAVRNLLARNRRALELLAELADLETARLYSERYDPLGALDTDLSRFPSAARLLLLTGKLAVAQEDRPGAAGAARTIARMAVAIETEPWLIHQQVGGVAERHYLALVQDLLHDDGEASLLDEVASNLEEFERLASPRRWLATEASLARDDRAGTEVDLSSSYDQLAAVADRSWSELAGWFETKSWHVGARDTPVGMVADLLFPNFRDALLKSKATAAARQLARLAIEARRYEAEHGRFPADLTALGLGELVDPLGGGAIVLEQRADGFLELSLIRAAALWEQGGCRDPLPQALLPWRLGRNALAVADADPRTATP